MANRTGHISIHGSVQTVNTHVLGEHIRNFMETLPDVRSAYKLLLFDDGDNVDVEFNDSAGTELHFTDWEGKGGGHIFQLYNRESSVETLPVLKKLLSYFDQMLLPYHVEVSYDYDDGTSEEDEIYRHPFFER